MHASVPIIVATGKGAKEVREAIRDLAHLTILAKPYLAEDLYRALRSLHVAVKQKTA
jgi:CheY-like chemotaxis protein